MGRVLIPLPDTDFDLTETAVPWRLLTRAGHQVVFATEAGAIPACDPLLITGVLFGQLGALPEAQAFYKEMLASPELQAPILYSAIVPGQYDGLVLPGGHAKGVKQYLDSETLRVKVAEFAVSGKPMCAICHGVLILARAKDPATGKSILHGRRTTCLPTYLERFAWYITHWWHGRYYRTYDTYTQEEVTAALGSPTQFERGPFNLSVMGSDTSDVGAFVVEDGNYISARWPGDVYLMSKKMLERLPKS